MNPTANFFSHCDAATARENIERTSAQAKNTNACQAAAGAGALKNTNAHTRARLAAKAFNTHQGGAPHVYD